MLLASIAVRGKYLSSGCFFTESETSKKDSRSYFSRVPNDMRNLCKYLDTCASILPATFDSISFVCRSTDAIVKKDETSRILHSFRSLALLIAALPTDPKSRRLKMPADVIARPIKLASSGKEFGFVLLPGANRCSANRSRLQRSASRCES